jgi:hypothetical protein
MAGTYTQSQTTFFLSMLSNLAITQKGTADTIEAFLAGRIDAHLQASVADIGVWTRAWGPAVFQAPLSDVADNVIYVAQSAATPPQYVLAIAGTNYNSIFDVLIEDFFVGSQVAWAYGRPPAGTSPKISAGTFTGLTLLQFMTPGPGMPGAGQKVADFLATATSRPIDVVTAGHSLGGALAPALALWLLNTQAIWDPQGRATIYCEPSAGPTSGNADFAIYYDQALGSRTTRIVNSLDMVPHAWNGANLASLPALYEPGIEPDLVVFGLAAAARRRLGRRRLHANQHLDASARRDRRHEPDQPELVRVRELPGPGRPTAHQRVPHVDGHQPQRRGGGGGHAGDGPPAAAGAAPRLRAQLVRRRAIPAEAGS